MFLSFGKMQKNHEEDDRTTAIKLLCFLLKESFRASKVYSLMSKDGLQSSCYSYCPKSGPLGPGLNQVRYLSHAWLWKVMKSKDL